MRSQHFIFWAGEKTSKTSYSNSPFSKINGDEILLSRVMKTDLLKSMLSLFPWFHVLWIPSRHAIVVFQNNIGLKFYALWLVCSFCSGCSIYFYFWKMRIIIFPSENQVSLSLTVQHFISIFHMRHLFMGMGSNLKWRKYLKYFRHTLIFNSHA